MINDPIGRPVRTDHPDGSYERHAHGVWKTQTWDRNDTLDDPDNLWRQACSATAMRPSSRRVAIPVS